MNKDQLQQDLLKNIKPGVKPSDLKKKAKNINGEKAPYFDILISPSHQENNTPASSPPASPIITPIDKKNQPKPSQESILPSPIDIELADQIKQLQQDVNYWATTAQTHLTNLQKTTAELDQAEERIKELEWVLKQRPKPETITQAAEQALMEANQKIRELEAKNQALKENITQLEKQAKTPTETKQRESKNQSTQTKFQPKLYLFTCTICDQNKKSQLHLAKVNGLGIDPNKQNKICDVCFKKVDVIQERKEDFF